MRAEGVVLGVFGDKIFRMGVIVHTGEEGCQPWTSFICGCQV